MLFQVGLLFFVIKKSPPALGDIRYFLINTSCIQITLINISSFLQMRYIPNSTTLALISNGLCAFFEIEVCFSGYHIHMMTTLATGLAISNTMLFRYLILARFKISKRMVKLMMFIAYIPPIIVLIIPFTDTWDFSSVKSQTVVEHPNYIISEPMVGFSNVHSAQFIAATFILSLGVYGIPSFCLILTRKVLKLIQTHNNMSEKTKSHSRMLIKGLMFQTALPMLSYIPIFTCYCYMQISEKELLLPQYLLMPLISVPGLIDPLISFYFIIPYRKLINDMLFKVMHIEGPSILFFLQEEFLKYHMIYGYLASGLFCGSFAFCIMAFAIHFIYRYLSVCRPNLLHVFNGPKLFLWYLIPSISMILWGSLNVWLYHADNFRRNYFREVMNKTYNEDVDRIIFLGPIYYLVDGKNNRHWLYKDVAGIVILCSLLSLSINFCLTCAFLTYRNLKNLSSITSTQNLALNRQLFISLLLQTVFPIITQYIPAALLYIFPFVGVNAGRLANWVGLSCSIYPALEPIIAILIIERFRKFVFCQAKLASNGTISTTNIETNIHNMREISVRRSISQSPVHSNN
ncbi:unnamed protein product [Caenorhabditis angaria]|uniref:Uncharacterized protein n=1 Tax=Caenorhabditis angaria TaxID=860376 RepID=A0A9P1IC23_9PELO|nr:unnamed protein product [Caenorhabditis angaria]